MDLDFTWKLKIRLADHLAVSSPFDPWEQKNWMTHLLRTYVRAGLLEVEVVVQKRRTCTRREETQIGELAYWTTSIAARAGHQPLLISRKKRVNPQAWYIRCCMGTAILMYRTTGIFFDCPL